MQPSLSHHLQGACDPLRKTGARDVQSEQRFVGVQRREWLINCDGKSEKTWAKLTLQGGEVRKAVEAEGMTQMERVFSDWAVIWCGRCRRLSWRAGGRSRWWDWTGSWSPIANVSEHILYSRSREKSLRNFKWENVNYQITLETEGLGSGQFGCQVSGWETRLAVLREEENTVSPRSGNSLSLALEWREACMMEPDGTAIDNWVAEGSQRVKDGEKASTVKPRDFCGRKTQIIMPLTKVSEVMGPFKRVISPGMSDIIPWHWGGTVGLDRSSWGSFTYIWLFKSQGKMRMSKGEGRKRRKE